MRRGASDNLIDKQLSGNHLIIVLSKSDKTEITDETSLGKCATF